MAKKRKKSQNRKVNMTNVLPTPSEQVIHPEPSPLKVEDLFYGAKLEYMSRHGHNTNVEVRDFKVGRSKQLQVKSKRGVWYNATDLAKSNKV